jgi:hypothetical protein
MLFEKSKFLLVGRALIVNKSFFHFYRISSLFGQVLGKCCNKFGHYYVITYGQVENIWFIVR